MNQSNSIKKHDAECRICGEITYRDSDTCMPCQIETNRIKNFIKRLGKKAIVILIDEVINWNRSKK